MSTRSTGHLRWPTDEPARRGTVTDRDGGYTLIELLMIVLILGVLLGAVVLALGGMSTEAADTGCDADRRQLDVAVGAFHAQTGNTTISAATSTVAEHDRFEQRLVDLGFVRTVSEFHDLDADGRVTPQEGSPC